MGKLISNRIRCLSCDGVIESLDRHHFITCSCGNVSADGGLSYLRRGFPSGDASEWFEELSEYEEVPDSSNGLDDGA